MAAGAEERPEPEALLDLARREGRGRLKIFLGAYPGVGKTCAMLEAAHERRREGVDAVVAVVETHGRAETARLLRGLETVPRREMSYRGRSFAEMDLDALLARRPKLALVDELAHANVPGSRHPKRWQDVEEVLAAGIDVYTTLNVQHIESLNDAVARISRVRVRETLPDRVLELADEIELVDLPPDDLIQRLREGKVYVRDQVGKALRHFFSKGNLTAFREMAMRVAAERVDAQMLSWMRQHAIPGPWPAQERLLVCIGEAPSGRQLVRSARRTADRLRVPWLAVHVATPKFAALPEAAREQVAEALRLAESLGGEAVTLHAESDIAGEVVAFARARNATRILVGRPAPRRWLAWLGGFPGTIGAEIVARAQDFDVTLIAPGEPEAARAALPPAPPQPVAAGSYVWATAAVAAAGLVAYAADRVLPLPNLSLIFLTAVLLVATRRGLWPSIYASLLSFLAYNFFFTVPFHTFTVSSRDDVLTIFVFLLAATVAGNLAGRLKAQVEAMRTTVRRMENLYRFSRSVAAAASLDDVLWAAVHHVAATLRCRSLVLLPAEAGRLEIAAGYPPEDRLAPRDRGAADWAWEKAEPAGHGSATLPAADWLFLPLATRRGPVGLLGVAFDGGGGALAPDSRRLLEALADQVAVAVERAKLAADIEDARLLTESEKLRSALLSSVSHDLRTPLVSIIGSATTLAERAERLGAADREALVHTVLEESERLDRYVQNLLDMTRLGYGALRPNLEWADLREIVGRALRQVARLTAGHRIETTLPADLPQLRVDPVLMEQVLVNLLDNAAKYAPAGSLVRIAAERCKGTVRLTLTDQGPGIPAEAREAVFDMFYRVRAGDRRSTGTGLGLSICRGLVEAHGGSIRAREGPGGRGLAVEIELPVPPQPALDEEE